MRKQRQKQQRDMTSAQYDMVDDRYQVLIEMADLIRAAGDEPKLDGAYSIARGMYHRNYGEALKGLKTLRENLCAQSPNFTLDSDRKRFRELAFTALNWTF